MVDRFLRLKEVAERLGIKRRTLIEYRSRKKLIIPIIKLGGMTGICESAFNAWLAEQGDNNIAKK